MGLINKNRLCAHNSMEFCVSLTTACHVLLVQTCQTMVKQLQHSLAATPAVRYRSLTMHRTVHNWLDGATLAIYTLIGTCSVQHFFGGRMHKVNTKFN